MRKRIIVTLLFFLQATMSWSYFDDYGPFEPKQHPGRYGLLEPKASIDLSTLWFGDRDCPVEVVFSNSCHRLYIIQPSDENFDWKVKVRLVDAQSDREVFNRVLPGSFRRETTVYAALLNEDEIPDWILETNSGGCGLAAMFSTQQILLSSEEGFEVLEVTVGCPSLNDYLDLDGNGRPELMHTAFVFGEEGKDGKSHNYWVYNLLKFSGTKIVSANDQDQRFPCWVWYSFKPNHKNTDQLSGEQRRWLWFNQESDVFPNSAALSDEQFMAALPQRVLRLIDDEDKIIACERGDLNSDALEDCILVLESSLVHPSRCLIVAIRQANGTLAIEKSNDSIIMNSEEGGIWGDPFSGIEITEDSFLIRHYGGSSWRWILTYSFGYSEKEQAWFLQKIMEDSFHTSDPEVNEITEYVAGKDFGDLIDISEFDSAMMDELRGK